MSNIDGFSPGVDKWLGHYVYRLVDPRDGQTFYVGMGKGDRVFSHYRNAVTPGADASDTDEQAKTALIQELVRHNLKPLYVIHRHGMTVDEARLVERVLIQSYRGLTNRLNPDAARGPATAEQLNRRYSLDTVPIEGHAIRITIRQKKLDEEHGDVYKAVCRAWIIGRARLLQINAHPHHVLVMLNRRCIEVYQVAENGWSECDMYSQPDKRKYKFTGQLAAESVRDRYIDRPFETSRGPIRFCGDFRRR